MATPTLPTTDPAPAPVAAAPSPWTDPATYLHVLALILTALLATNTLPTSGPVAQIVAIAASVLTALGYPVTREIIARAAARHAEQAHLATALHASMRAHNELAVSTIYTLITRTPTSAAGGAS